MSRKGSRTTLCLMLLLAVQGGIAADCLNDLPNNVPHVVEGKTLFKSAILNVDADGAPNAYRIDGKGLSYTCDGVVAFENGHRVTSDTDKDHWQQKCQAAWAKAKATGDYSGVAIFGFLFDKEKGLVKQGEGDPLPDVAYVSITSMSIPGASSTSQRQYVDATLIPYVVLPKAYAARHRIQYGTLALVFRPKTNAYAFAVFADKGKFGEASIKLHENLGSKPIVKRFGVSRAKRQIEDTTLTVLFPNRVVPPDTDQSKWNLAIEAAGAEEFQALGGLQGLQRLCGPQGGRSTK